MIHPQHPQMRRACFARVEEQRAARAAREERRIPVFTEKTDSPVLEKKLEN